MKRCRRGFALPSSLQLPISPFSNHRHMWNVIEFPIEIRVPRASTGKVSSYRGISKCVCTMRGPIENGSWPRPAMLLIVITTIELQCLNTFAAFVSVEPAFGQQRTHGLDAILNAQ